MFIAYSLIKCILSAMYLEYSLLDVGRLKGIKMHNIQILLQETADTELSV